MQVLITGFTPFDGRPVNGSWLAAQSLAAVPEVQTLEIPVVWGAPLPALKLACRQFEPQIIISLGEGHPGEFTIETLARNQRAPRPDNLGELPAEALISALGPATHHASIDAAALQARLRSNQPLPVRLSTDAGAFLCEETLYTLESLKAAQANLQTVVFVHLPPFGTTLQVDGADLLCDAELLSGFARQLLAAVLAQAADSS
jgi:pyroglutamyl-peptidase